MLPRLSLTKLACGGLFLLVRLYSSRTFTPPNRCPGHIVVKIKF